MAIWQSARTTPERPRRLRLARPRPRLGAAARPAARRRPSSWRDQTCRSRSAAAGAVGDGDDAARTISPWLAAPIPEATAAGGSTSSLTSFVAPQCARRVRLRRSNGRDGAAAARERHLPQHGIGRAPEPGRRPDSRGPGQPRLLRHPVRATTRTASSARRHAELLAELSGAVRAFHDDLAAARLDDRVAVLCFSEFGRRVEENGSRGTDHGTAGPVFLVGSRVHGGLIGTPPSLVDLDAEGDLKMTVDFRRVYASVLENWLEIPSQPVLGNSYAPLPLFKA